MTHRYGAIPILVKTIPAIALVLVACGRAQPPTVVTPNTVAFAPHARQVLPFSDGDARQGRATFVDLQCHVCHRVAGDDSLPVVEGATRGPVLKDLGSVPPEIIGWRIVTQTRHDPEALYDSAMTEAASAMSERQLVDVIAYLRNPIAGRDENQ